MGPSSGGVFRAYDYFLFEADKYTLSEQVSDIDFILNVIIMNINWNKNYIYDSQLIITRKCFMLSINEINIVMKIKNRIL